VVFTKIIDEDVAELSEERRLGIEAAYQKANKLFRSANLPGGTHKLPIDATFALIQLIRVNDGDVSWEIGCGSLQLAYSLSNAANGGHVVAVDLRKLVLTNWWFTIYC
jgi:hypothetical protein